MSEEKPMTGNRSGSTGPHKSGTGSEGDLNGNPWADLVLAILAVNHYSLEKVYRLESALENNGLFDPTNLARWDRTEIARRLKAAGYDRGHGMTAIFAERLASLGLLADDVAAHRRVLSEGTSEQIRTTLLKVKGIGPTVLTNFAILRS